jgi:hypothetical protein
MDTDRNGFVLPTIVPNQAGGSDVITDAALMSGRTPKCNFTATTDPGSGNNASDVITGDSTACGYQVGSRWLNTTGTPTLWVCVASSSGAATWVKAEATTTPTPGLDPVLAAGGVSTNPATVGNFTATGSISVGNATITGDASLGNNLYVSAGGAVTIAGYLYNTGSLTMGSGSILDDGSGNATIVGNVTMQGSITSANGSTLNDGSGNTTIASYLYIHGSLTMGSESILDDSWGNTTIAGYLHTQGSISSLYNTLDDGGGNATIAGNLFTTGLVSLGNNLYVSAGSITGAFAPVIAPPDYATSSNWIAGPSGMNVQHVSYWGYDYVIGSSSPSDNRPFTWWNGNTGNLNTPDPTLAAYTQLMQLDSGGNLTIAGNVVVNTTVNAGTFQNGTNVGTTGSTNGIITASGLVISNTLGSAATHPSTDFQTAGSYAVQAGNNFTGQIGVASNTLSVGNATIGGTLAITGNTTFSGSLTGTGAISFQSTNLTCTNGSTILGNSNSAAVVRGTLIVGSGVPNKSTNLAMVIAQNGQNGGIYFYGDGSVAFSPGYPGMTINNSGLPFFNGVFLKSGTYTGRAGVYGSGASTGNGPLALQTATHTNIASFRCNGCNVSVGGYINITSYTAGASAQFQVVFTDENAVVQTILLPLSSPLGVVAASAVSAGFWVVPQVYVYGLNNTTVYGGVVVTGSLVYDSTPVITPWI